MGQRSGGGNRVGQCASLAKCHSIQATDEATDGAAQLLLAAGQKGTRRRHHSQAEGQTRGKGEGRGDERVNSARCCGSGDGDVCD